MLVIDQGVLIEGLEVRTLTDAELHEQGEQLARATAIERPLPVRARPRPGLPPACRPVLGALGVVWERVS